MENVNTKKMSQDELKETLKRRAREEGVDRKPYTIWCENGDYSPGAQHLHLEGSAADAAEKDFEVGEAILKCGHSRIMILDAVHDQIEIVLPDGKVTVVVPRPR
jgi:hypothetical protein